MDMFQQSYNMKQPPLYNRHSEQMETASLVLGIIAIASCTCIYLSIPCGALAIIMASLSRGGRMHYGSKAQIGMILGILGLVFTLALYSVCVAYAFYEYGSIEGILQAYSDMYGIDYESLMQQLYPAN